MKKNVKNQNKNTVLQYAEIKPANLLTVEIKNKSLKLLRRENNFTKSHIHGHF